MLNKDLEKTLNEAFKLARDERHEFMTVEHLLLALLDNSSAHEALNSCGADVEQMRKEIRAFINQTTPLIPRDDEDRETQPTLGFQRVLQRAVFHVQSSGNTEVSGANVLVAIFSEQESQAAYFLKKAEISRLDVVNFLSHGVRKDSKPESGGNNAESDDEVSSAQIEKLRHQPQPAGTGGAHRSADRSRSGAQSHHSGVVPSPQEQSLAGGGGRGGQDRHR